MATNVSGNPNACLQPVSLSSCSSAAFHCFLLPAKQQAAGSGACSSMELCSAQLNGLSATVCLCVCVGCKLGPHFACWARIRRPLRPLSSLNSTQLPAAKLRPHTLLPVPDQSHAPRFLSSSFEAARRLLVGCLSLRVLAWLQFGRRCLARPSSWAFWGHFGASFKRASLGPRRALQEARIG